MISFWFEEWELGKFCKGKQKRCESHIIICKESWICSWEIMQKGQIVKSRVGNRTNRIWFGGSNISFFKLSNELKICEFENQVPIFFFIEKLISISKISEFENQFRIEKFSEFLNFFENFGKYISTYLYIHK